LRVARERLSEHFSQDGMDGFAQTQSAATAGNSDTPFPVRKLTRQPFPAAPCLRDIEHRIEQGPTRNRGVSTIRLGLRYQQADNRSFRIAQITWLRFV
jgi:hypothetical protein